MPSPRLEQVGCEWLLRSGIHMAKQGRYCYSSDPLWSLVADLAGVGSTSATQICRELGWNPNQEAGKELPPFSS